MLPELMLGWKSYLQSLCMLLVEEWSAVGGLGKLNVENPGL